jgi:phosphate-selective porin OprO/OprP
MGSTNISMMEYTTPANVFGLGRRIGISSEHLFAHDRVRLFFGVFQSDSTDINRRLREDNQGQTVNLRLSAAPWYAQEGKCVLHLGGHWEYVSTKDGTATLSATPGTFGFGIPATLASEKFPNDYSNRGGLEFAYQNGRFSTRSELFAGCFETYNGEPTRHLYGTYVELAYFLTDDFRTYDLKSGAFGGVKMRRNFHPFKCGEWNLVDGWGAWQAVFQWGYTDMVDWRRTAGDNHYGGYQNDFVVGMNWFWTPQLRWMFQYVRSEQCVGESYTHKSQDIFATSLRVHF